MVELYPKYQEDLNYLINKYEEVFVAPYYCCTKKEIEDFIESYLYMHNIQNDLDFLYFLKCLIKKLNGVLDSHTTVKRNRKFFPLLLKMYDNELYVIKTGHGLENLKFTKLKSINNIPYKELINEIEAAISYSTNGWKKAMLERELDELYSILYLPSIKAEDDRLKLIFENDSQEEISFEFDENSKIEDISLEKENCSFEVDKDTLHYIYNSCVISEQEKLIKSIEKIEKIEKKNIIKNFILDLRGNTGGSSLVIKPLIEYLSTKKYHLYVFIDRYTFSSGIMALEDILSLGAISIGEDIGSTLNSFGNLDGLFELPNTKFSLRIATKYFPAKGGAIVSQTDFKNRVNKEDLIPVFYEPDIVACESINDYKKGIDRWMEAFYKIKKNSV